jgi:TolC family type I secretion outer membrane protein
MKFRRLGPAIAALALMTSTASAETLYDAMRDAYFYNPSVEAERANLRALGENVPIARAGFLPTLSFQLSQQLNTSLTNPDFGASRAQRPLTAALQGSLNLYDGGQTANQVSEAEANVEAAYASLNATEQQTLLAATQAFFDVLRDAEIRNLSRRNLSNLNEALDAAKLRFEVGEVTLTDVAQAESRVAAANSTLVQSEGNLRTSAATYRNVVGRLPSRLEPPESLPEIPDSLPAAEADALATQPSIRAARAAERAAIFAIRRSMAGKLPTVNLDSTLSGSLSDGIIGDSFFSNRSSDNRSASVGLQLTLNAPIYQGGRVDAQVRQARHLASRARAQYHEAVRTVEQNVNISWQTLVTARGSIEANLERVRAARIAYEGVQEELRVGTRSTIDLLDAEAELLNAQIALVQATRGLNVAAYSLLASMGRLNPENLGLNRVIDARTDLSVLTPGISYDYPRDTTAAWRFPWRP